MSATSKTKAYDPRLARGLARRIFIANRHTIWSASPRAGENRQKGYIGGAIARRVAWLIVPVCRAAGILTSPSPIAVTTADRLGEAGGPHGLGAGDRVLPGFSEPQRCDRESELFESVWAIYCGGANDAGFYRRARTFDLELLYKALRA